MSFQLDSNTGVLIQQDGASDTPLRRGRYSDLIVQDAHARYFEEASRGFTFSTSNTAATAFSAVSTTATGFILSNPLTTAPAKNLVIIDIMFQYTAATAAAAIAILYANTNPAAAAVIHTTPLTITPTLLGGSTASVAKADSAATLPATPTAVRVLWAAVGTGAATNSLNAPFKDEVGGLFIVAPGCALSIQGSAAIAGGVASMTWAEVLI